MMDSGPAKPAEPDAASLKPARAGIDTHTKANPQTIAMSDPKKMLLGLRRDFSRSDRNGRFIYEKRSFPVSIILPTNQPAPDNERKCTMRRGVATIRSLCPRRSKNE